MNARFPFYVVSLLAGSLGFGLAIPAPLRARGGGNVVGQAGYGLLFNIGALFILGVVSLLGYNLLFLAGAAVGALVLWWSG